MMNRGSLEKMFVGYFGDTNHNRSLSRVDEEDKLEHCIVDSMGRMQKAILINESGLYSLLFAMQPQKANKNGVADAYPHRSSSNMGLYLQTLLSDLKN